MSTSWSMEHLPLQPRAQHFLVSLVELAKEADEQLSVEVVNTTL